MDGTIWKHGSGSLCFLLESESDKLIQYRIYLDIGFVPTFYIQLYTEALMR